MTEAQFRKTCLAVMGEHRAKDCAAWSVPYLLTTLRHLGSAGMELCHRYAPASATSEQDTRAYWLGLYPDGNFPEGV